MSSSQILNEGLDVYAISYYKCFDESSNSIHVEFVDCETLDSCIKNSESNFYNEAKIYSVRFSIRDYLALFGKENGTLAKENSGNIHKVHISHVTKHAVGNKRTYSFENDYSGNVYQYSSKSRITIEKLTVLNTEESERIRSFIMRVLNQPVLHDLHDVENINLRQYIVSGKRYEFNVHYVGQGLATSLSIEGEPPFFYFDFGTGYGPNKSNPSDSISLPVNKDTLIVISHLHEDHWCGFRVNPDALECTWIFPNQTRSLGLNQLINSILLKKGTVYSYSGDLKLHPIYIGHTSSTISSTRVAKQKHETGYAMYINGKQKGEDYRITVSGDQDYDYQDSKQYEYSNVLVACHHGGKYCWSKLFKQITPSPNGTIVYSYKTNNTHNHPLPDSRRNYTIWGWDNYHETPISGDFITEMFF